MSATVPRGPTGSESRRGGGAACSSPAPSALERACAFCEGADATRASAVTQDADNSGLEGADLEARSFSISDCEWEVVCDGVGVPFWLDDKVWRMPQAPIEQSQLALDNRLANAPQSVPDAAAEQSTDPSTPLERLC